VTSGPGTGPGERSGRDAGSDVGDDGGDAGHGDRRRAAALAGHAGDEPAARALLADPHASVRATALGALARLDALDDGVVAHAAADADSAVRRRAATLTATGAGLDTTLVALLDDADPTVVETAAWAAGERWEAPGSGTTVGPHDPCDPGALARLVEITTGHDDALCREAAVAALGSIGDERGRAAVLAAMADRATVRRRAVLALVAFEGPDIDAALDAARADRDWQVRQAAEDLADDRPTGPTD
jgi:HEAT repeat protein